MIYRSTILAAALCLAGSVAMAQVPPDIAAKNKAIGQNIDTAATAAIYGPLQKHEPYNVAGLHIGRDVPYGPAPLEKLDLFTMGIVPGQAPRPVLIFVHGGGFTGGSKSAVINGVRNPTYDNVMLWAAEHGMVGINMDYELAPKATYPTVQKEIATVIAWAQKNAALHGGDPKRIYLMGHSAGGSHVAAYAGSPEFYPAGGMGLAGLIISSGTADTITSPRSTYFVPVEQYGKLDFVPTLLASKLPILVFRAEYDPDWAVKAFKRFEDLSAKAAVKPQFRVNMGHGHLSESYSIGTADQSVSAPLEAFIKAKR